MFSKESLALLGLTEEENALFQALREQSLHISALSRTSGQPRTSIYPRLTHLKNRGLITTTRHGKRQYWKAVSSRKLQERLFKLAHSYQTAEDSGEQELGLVSAQQSEYKVYHGREKLMQIYDELGKLPRESRLYGIQPNVSAYSVMKKFDFDRLVKINQEIKDRKIIVEAVLQENFLDYYVSQLKKEKKPAKDILQAYGGRLAVTHYVPQERINFDSEVMFYTNVVIIANWQEAVAVVIKNKEVFGLVLEFFESLKTMGRRVDQNPKVKELLQKFSETGVN